MISRRVTMIYMDTISTEGNNTEGGNDTRAHEEVDVTTEDANTIAYSL